MRELDQNHVALCCLSLHNPFLHIQMMKDVTEFSLVHFHRTNDVQKLNFNLYREINKKKYFVIMNVGRSCRVVKPCNLWVKVTFLFSFS